MIKENMKKHLLHLLCCFLLHPTAFATNQCSDFFTKLSIQEKSITRVEYLFGKTVKIKDRSHLANERSSYKSPDVKVIDIEFAFSPNEVVLGFGRPNVFLTIPQAKGPSPLRFAAKSLKRADSVLESTKGRMQSGVFLVFKDLPSNTIQQLFESAQKHEGTRRWTCVNANCRVLSDSGFTIGKENLNDIYFPVSLLRKILKNGIQHNGKEIEYELVRTTPDSLEKHGLSIINSEFRTPCRHAKRACKNGSPLNATLVRLKDRFSSSLGVFFQKKKMDSTALSQESRSPQLPPTHSKQKHELSVSNPSKLGLLLRMLWGPHSLYELRQNRIHIDHYLKENLKEFPQEDPNFATKLKKNFLFSKPVIQFIRNHLSKNYTSFPQMTTKSLFDMMETSTKENDSRYNIVITKEKITVSKLDIKYKYVDWLMNKHVLLSKYSNQVRFAGEVWKTEDGTIYINNNSGTYQPNASQLQAASQYLRSIFPDLKIEAAEH